MRKSSIYIIAAVIIIVIVGLVIFNSYSKNTTFNDVVLEKINTDQISSLEILKSSNDEKKTITDKSEINKIMNSLSVIKLREGSYSIDSTEPYYITIKTNNLRRFGMTLYDKNYLKIFDYDPEIPKNSTKSYKISNEFDPAIIRSLFM
ncbi:hypothetical protein J23TS9_36260 [Paenibacillus sp. J23TS9]|uniref:hypothetical protein n=1 Tax=Paenibacillus sp. J23TS9 TaxID=2807193 RepID=UPI001B0035B7|nr:hypothetical protein [Paenibacillus sp. J23TS9]GIP28496.1 hypothetical protein J23TS9_36260 [Paenibacillus sp. J23TS9]